MIAGYISVSLLAKVGETSEEFLKTAMKDCGASIQTLVDCIHVVIASTEVAADLFNATFGKTIDSNFALLVLLMHASTVRGLQRRLGPDLTRLAKSLRLDCRHWTLARGFLVEDLRATRLYAQRHHLRPNVFHSAVIAATLGYLIDNVIENARRNNLFAVGVKTEKGITIFRRLSENEREQPN